MTGRTTLVSLIALVLGGIGAWMILSGPGGTQLPPTQSYGKALVGGPFSLVDHTGKAVTEKDFLGKKMLVFFGFTSCPDVCPTGLQAMSAALESLGSKADGLTPVFITVDPERDTPEKLAEYVKSFHPRLVGLTGAPDAVAAAAKAYRVYAKKVPTEGQPGSYSIDHSAVIYLMDEQGVFIRPFNHGSDPLKLAADLAKSL